MKLTNQLVSILLLLLLPSGIWSQEEVDTMEIDGKEYLVYPFNAEFEISYHYWGIQKEKKPRNQRYSYERYLDEVSPMVPDSMIITKDEFKVLKKIIGTKSYKKFQRLYIPKFGPMPTEEEFKTYLKYRKRRPFKRKNKGYQEDKYLQSRKFKKAVMANPYPMLLQDFEIESDVIPVLDPIPDGEYVQLYDSYCLLDEKGNCMWISDQVAGHFSIENNVLHGEATWLGVKGDTLKHGWFDHGLKEGVWKIIEYKMNRLNEDEVDLYIESGSPTIDTTSEIIEFSKGSMNGKYQYFESGDLPLKEGYYTDNEETGEWIFRSGYFNDLGIYSIQEPGDPAQIVSRYTLNNDDSLIVKPILIRDGVIRYWGYDEGNFNFDSKYSIRDIPSRMYEPAFERELDLDLDEEKDNIRDYEYEYDGYEGEYGYEEYGYDDYGYDDFGEDSFSHYQATIFDKNEEKYKKRGVVYDSIGAYPKYLGSYERYYPNGQLMYKHEFDNGLLKEEPIIYWDNGTVHDEVIFVADSNHYQRNVYDYDGKIYKSFVFDSIGDFVKIIREVDEIKYITIDGLEIKDYEYGNMWHYNIPDSVYEGTMTEQVLNNRTWSKIDTSTLWEGYYDPIERVRTITTYAVDGTQNYKFTGQFSEGFESWTGKSHYYFGDLELETIKSASFQEGRDKDSIPQLHATRMFHYFKVTDDCTLKQNGELYSGELKIDLSAKKLAIKSGLVVEMEAYDVDTEKLQKNFWTYKEKGKNKNPLELSQVNASNFTAGSASDVFGDIFQPLLGGFFRYSKPYDYYWEDEYYDEFDEGRKPKKTKKKDQESRVELIEGSILDGKPIGEWTSYDQFGNVLMVVPFDKGEANGRVRYYDFQDPKNDYEYYYDNQFQDTFPEKKTYYLSGIEDYVNGKMDGKSIEYNWLNEVVSEVDYKEGYPHGQSMERNNIATSISQYQDGALDGYMKTYLTLPGKDSLLLYDLLFQNGMLQGESKSYHTNGNISKRGFFLAGQPIDDYEGFDSLGFRYHYVKFNYSYPVEEKIWEENELSVRYMFDWEDSIYFSPIDITESESLDALLIKQGFGGYGEPYYGRPSLVEKGGIDYRLTKYYPNDTVARDGMISKGRKSGCWEYFSYEGEKLHQIDYFDSIIVLNDSIKYNSKGIYTEVDADGAVLYESYIIEKFERYDCSHSDHYETRQLKTIWEANDTLNRMNGDVMNFYDNGTIQSAGKMKDGMPDGEWRFYDPNGKLNKYGHYVLGKRDGRWLSGDLSKTKYLGEICLNPNMPDIEEEIKYRENMLDIEIIYYKLGKSLHREFYDVNMNFRNNYDEDEDEETEESEGEFDEEGSEEPDEESNDDPDTNEGSEEEEE